MTWGSNPEPDPPFMLWWEPLLVALVALGGGLVAAALARLLGCGAAVLLLSLKRGGENEHRRSALDLG